VTNLLIKDKLKEINYEINKFNLLQVYNMKISNTNYVKNDEINIINISILLLKLSSSASYTY